MPAARSAAGAAAPAPVNPRKAQKSVLAESNVREVLAALGDSTAAHRALAGRVPSLKAAHEPEPAKPGESARIFAVQLVWSEEPLDLTKIVMLPVFRQYTLYKVQGRREGRRCHALRLGFFVNAEAAKQVAYAARSEFASVSVVAVTAKEQARVGVRGAEPAGTREPRPQPVARQPIAKAMLTAPARPGVQPARRSSGPPAARSEPSIDRLDTLEAALEILGGRDAAPVELEPDPAIPTHSDDMRWTTPFSRLLGRLADRIKRF